MRCPPGDGRQPINLARRSDPTATTATVVRLRSDNLKAEAMTEHENYRVLAATEEDGVA